MDSYDPVVRHRAIERLVVRGVDGLQKRKYWRFRFDRWYGGIVTADAVGCGLMCKFCWVSDSVMFRPAKTGRFYSPKEVAEILVGMAERRGMRRLRVSGAEPAIGRRHLLQLLGHLDGLGLLFILETNGILIGHNTNYAEELSRYPFVHVRISLKGCNEEEFTMLTNAKKDGFKLQLKALENLTKSNVPCHPAVMASFSPRKSVQRLVQRLREIRPELAGELEMEELILYPNVQRKIRRHGLRYYRAYTPQGIPKKLI